MVKHQYFRHLMRRVDSLEKTPMLGKTDLKLNTQNTKIMASSPMTAWPIEGEKVAAVTDFYFPGLQNHDGCSHDVKRRLLLGREAMTNLNSILKSKDITLTTKIRIVKAMVFPVVSRCDSWTIRKAEHQRIDAF